jgi:hypothetical protein
MSSMSGFTTTKRREDGWMKLVRLTMLSLLGSGWLTGCGIAVNNSAICDGTKRLRDAHTEALLDDGGDRSVITGSALIGAIDAGCSDV